MKCIELLYVKNQIVRCGGTLRQELSFSMLVENLASDKTVEVRWAGEDGVWHTLVARYHSPAGCSRELWQAEACLCAEAGAGLPGNIRFALGCSMAGCRYWDNNGLENHLADAGGGIMVQPDLPLLNIQWSTSLEQNRDFYRLTAAVRHELRPRRVFVRWSKDHWQSSATADCSLQLRHWNPDCPDPVVNPGKYGYETWTGQIDVRDAFSIEYALGCETVEGAFWDNNFGCNYQARRAPLRVLTLNLHCFQEENQDEKLSLIARAVTELDIAIVCLQEACEPWNEGCGDPGANAAKIICDRLKEPYHLYTCWSHMGFNAYREGSAILSRYPFVRRDSAYVSESRDERDVNSRRVCMAQVLAPGMGRINIFSVHLSWPEGGFRAQFESLAGWATWAAGHHGALADATLLCGDFNVTAGGEDYHFAARDYEDQFLMAGPAAVSAAPQHQPAEGRIDYIFMNKGGRLRAAAGRALFTDQDYGRVSDHCGYLIDFEPA